MLGKAARLGQVFAASLLACHVALANAQSDSANDEIVLKNGSRLIGTVTGSREGVVIMETDFAGTVRIAQEEIDSLRTGEVFVLKLDDGTVLENQRLIVEGNELVLPATVDTAEAYSLTQLQLVNPEPWELGQGYKWTGLASLALTIQSGNTDTEELDYRLDSVWRSLRDRYTLKIKGEIDEANNVKNAENWTALAKYDYFIDGPWYWGLNAGVEQDKFADLDLRYYLGPYIGRQFYDEPVLRLSAEGGLVYVKEDFMVGDDKEYPGANWTVHASSNYLGGNSRLYFDHQGILNLDDSEDLILNTTLGLAFPLMLNIEAAAELLVEYDSGAPAAVDKVDQTYRFRLGYTW